MKTTSSGLWFCRVTLLAGIFAGAGIASHAQQVLMPPRFPAQGTAVAQSAPARAGAGDTQAAVGADQRAEIYFDVTMAHLYELDYETSSKSEDANRAIDFYKKAYALDPNSPVIGEQLAEMYFVAQRIRDAVTEAQQILRRDPSNLPTRRLLARIYIRSLGDLSKSADEQATVALALEQLKQIVRLDPTDVESALWLARLDRLAGEQDEAEKVLRGILAGDPNNESALQQLTQLLLDASKSNEAVDLLEQALARTPSADLYDQLGDAYAQLHDDGDAEKHTAARWNSNRTRPATAGRWRNRFSIRKSTRRPTLSIRNWRMPNPMTRIIICGWRRSTDHCGISIKRSRKCCWRRSALRGTWKFYTTKLPFTRRKSVTTTPFGCFRMPWLGLKLKPR